MDVTLSVKHQKAKESELYHELCAFFGNGAKKSALSNSIKYSALADDPDAVIYAAERRGYRILCFRITSSELQVAIEPKRGEDARRSAQSAWNGLRQALTLRSPELLEAEISDSDRAIFVGAVGFRSHLSATEAKAVLALAGGNVAWIVIAAATIPEVAIPELIAGGAPALIAGLVYSRNRC